MISKLFATRRASLPQPVTSPVVGGINSDVDGSSNRNRDRGSAPQRKTTFDDGNLQSAVKVHWAKFKKRLGNVNGSMLSESVVEVTDGGTTSETALKRYPESTGGNQVDGTDDDEVDEVVIDNDFWAEACGSKTVTQPSERGAATPDVSGTHGGTHMTDHDSLHEEGITKILASLQSCWWRIRTVFMQFFFTGFYDKVAEAQYRKETYFQSKALAIWGSCFVIMNWILVCILIDKENEIFWDKIFYYAPLPGSASAAYGHLRLAKEVSSVLPALYVFVSLLMGRVHYTSAFPVIALFALGQNRLPAAICGILITAGIALVIPQSQSWIRNTLNYIIYIVFLLWIHYQRESAERRLYTMRDRLKVQYKATQKAQVNESKAADSRKRFSSYIFHEVRVPLNTALLAVQNMDAEGMFNKDDIEYTALEGSLNMMSKVLNDVLDFNRMDSGRFESVAKPYAFHKVLKGMLVPLKLAAAARGLDLIIELDQQIDMSARLALYKGKGEPEEWIKEQLQGRDDEEAGLVVGDEHRLRQIVTNLTSNACKFTPAGGKIIVRTKMLRPGLAPHDARELNNAIDLSWPQAEAKELNEEVEGVESRANGEGRCRLSAAQLALHNAPLGCTVEDRLIIRIEVEDTGVGIKRKDMVDNRLFSPYVQTDIGRYQGGKGTGLGLALSKQIVRLSGGRLGVKSKRDAGSTFWVELPVGIGRKVLERSEGSEKDDRVAQTFGALENEGVTPSSSTSPDTSPLENVFPSATRKSPPSSTSNDAMRHLMEHSGNIDILRPPEYMADSSVLSLHQSNISQVNENGLTGPKHSVNFSQSAKRISGSALHRPPRLPLPAQQTSFASTYASSGTTGSRLTEVSHLPAGASLPPGFTKATEGSKILRSDQVNPIQAEDAAVKLQDPLPIATALAPGPEHGVPEPASTLLLPSPPAVMCSQPTSSTLAITSPSISPPVPGPSTNFDPPLIVLIVDDDGLTRKLMSRMLTRIGCVVELAENGKIALDMICQVKNPFTFAPSQPGEQPKRVQTPYMSEDQPRYDVIFLDNQMPIMSGVEMVKRLRGLQRKDFVVGVTGNALKEDQNEYLDAGVDA
ncbi:hypothetical protein FRB97_002835 [Tulasnella sp. 331]|nr:hypothetical protein FRB97_002835 [Tulasnella sp. 331]KAG8884104.1 hypothetical protein FRB98_002629 [Tulasnella sp. 332]